MNIFISHSSKDKDYVDALQILLRLGLRGVSAQQIRVSSIEELQLGPGAKIDDSLREEIRDAAVLIAVLSPSALGSLYVIFELGARWGAGQDVFPILVPGLKRGALSGPLRGMNVLESTEAQLYQLVQAAAESLSIEHEPEGYLKSQIDNVLKAKPGQEPLRYAVLSYVVDRHFDFALLQDEYYRKIQPPGRKLEQYERPHDVAWNIVVRELDLPVGELKRMPEFVEQRHGETYIVAPPYQVQLEKNLHRTALAHYDFVYLFSIDRERPRLGPYEREHHKRNAAWYSLEEVKARVGYEFGPHEDMIPTMERIMRDFGRAT